ncbi:unnamed protein product [Soboliphyme baturini]|uniref:Transmembrane protein n=1 Tax=Soboliphyme baturini TaxID=241478 RepID=A0A183IJC8_9BILA|nr:unnamed protein product [Soboliphyme baturini]
MTVSKISEQDLERIRAERVSRSNPIPDTILKMNLTAEVALDPLRSSRLKADMNDRNNDPVVLPVAEENIVKVDPSCSDPDIKDRWCVATHEISDVISDSSGIVGFSLVFGFVFMLVVDRLIRGRFHHNASLSLGKLFELL